MKLVLLRIAGIALIVAGATGLLFSIVGLVVLGRVHQRVEPVLMEQLELADRTLAAIADGLAVAETSLTDAVDMAGSIETTMASVGQAVGDTVPTVETVGEMLGEKLPTTLKATQDTLASVAQSARIIDNVLAVVTAIPFLGLERYNPEIPFHEGLDEVAGSLDDIPTSLVSAQEGLSVAGGNLEELQGDLTTMAESIDRLASSLESAQSVVVRYQEIIVDVQKLVAAVRQGLPQWMRWTRLGLSLLLVWLGIAQIGLLTQGWELMVRGRSDASEATGTEPVSEGTQDQKDDEGAK